MIRLGVVILNWNGYKDTIECLDSISNSQLEGFKLRVVVVDNASSDNSVVKIKKYKSLRTGVSHDPEAKLKHFDFEILRNKKNLGFAGGNNAGIQFLLKRKIEHVLILNNDTLVDKNFLSELVKFAGKKPSYGVLSPKIYFAKGYEFHKNRYKKSDLGHVIWSAGGNMDWENVFGKNRGVDEVDRDQYQKTEMIDFATGAAMMLNTKVLKKVGRFDERYFMYFEDADLVTRAIKMGFISYYVPKAVVWHKVARSSGIGSDLNDYFITRNRLLFGTMYAPVRSKLALCKESIKFLLKGRKWQRIGVKDYYLRKFGKGSWRS